VIVLRLGIEPTDLELDERDRMKLTVTAVNAGAEMIDPELRRTDLLVDGEPSMAFSETIANGRRAEKWYALPPGDTVSMTWGGLGSILLPGPGEYTLELALDNERSEPVTVTVR
jgi:hypothetical protein